MSIINFNLFLQASLCTYMVSRFGRDRERAQATGDRRRRDRRPTREERRDARLCNVRLLRIMRWVGMIVVVAAMRVFFNADKDKIHHVTCDTYVTVRQYKYKQ